MTLWLRGHRALALGIALAVLLVCTSPAQAYVLVGDRPQTRILKYSDSGTYLGVVVSDAANLMGMSPNDGGPSAMVLSPDGTKLYVASGNNNIVRYDFNGTTAVNPLVFTSNGSSTVNGPSGLLFSADGSTLYVGNRGFGSSNVARFSPAGVSLGANLTGGPSTGRTDLAIGPSGELLVATFNAPTQPAGVLRFDPNTSQFVDLIAPTATLSGITSLLVSGNDLYVAAGFGPEFAGRLAKYTITGTTAAADVGFGLGGAIIPPVAFPSSLTPSAQGGMLMSMLGFVAGQGRVDRFGFDGTNLGVWATATADPQNGFTEPSVLLQVVPEPGSLLTAIVALAAGIAARRRALPSHA